MTAAGGVVTHAKLYNKRQTLNSATQAMNLHVISHSALSCQYGTDLTKRFIPPNRRKVVLHGASQSVQSEPLVGGTSVLLTNPAQNYTEET